MVNMYGTIEYDLMSAIVYHNSLEELKKLFEPVVDKYLSGGKVLSYASSHEYLPCLQYLIENGADINGLDLNGSTALHLAATKNSQKSLKYLVEHGADINACDKHGRTPLYNAISAKYIAVITYLAEHGADLSIKDEWGMTPYDFAKYRGFDDIVKLLEPVMEQCCLEKTIQDRQADQQRMIF